MTSEIERAKRGLAVARGRVAQYERAWGIGRRDRDLSRRLSDALRRVRWLELSEVTEGMLAA